VSKFKYFEYRISGYHYYAEDSKDLTLTSIAETLSMVFFRYAGYMSITAVELELSVFCEWI
jgi:hypothetical protein